MLVYKKLLNATEAEASEYWLAVYSLQSDQRKSITTDKQGNAIVAAIQESVGASVTKIALDSSVLWSKSLAGSPAVYNGGIAANGQDIFLAGRQGSSSAAEETSALLVNFGKSGSTTWPRSLNNTDISSDLYGDLFKDCEVDASGNIIAAGNKNAGVGSADGLIAKYNSSGTLQWQRALTGDSPIEISSVGVDTSGKIMVAFRATGVGGSGSKYSFVRYDADGTKSSVYTYGNSTTSTTLDGSGVRVRGDSLGNFISAGTIQDGTSATNPVKTFVSKIGPSSITWSREFYDTTSDSRVYVEDLTCDRFGNIYVCSRYIEDYSAASGDYITIVAKYNSSGTLQWQKAISHTSSSGLLPLGITTANNGDVYFCGSVSEGAGYAQLVVIKLPPSGSANGTYGNFTIANGSLTEATSSVAIGSDTFTGSTPTLTSATPSIVTTSRTVTKTSYTITT